MIKFFIGGIVACGLSTSVCGYDWSQHAAGATVALPAGDAEVTDADYAAVSALAKIDLASPDCRIVFNLSSDMTAAPLGCSISGWGTIVKRGVGTLHFGAPHNTILISNQGWADYYTTNGVVVEAGTLKLPQDVASMLRLGPVTLSAGAVLYAPNRSEVVVESLNGYGTVTNTATARAAFRIGNSPMTTAKSVFHGLLAGEFMQVRTDGFVELLNTGNTFGSDLQCVLNADGYTKTNRGIAAVASLGLKGQPSAMGTSTQMQLRYGGTLRYLGTGETCDKRLYLFAVARTPNALDAGSTGGINWTGEFYSRSTADGRLVLKGDGPAENVWSGKWDMDYLGWTHYIAKEGAGTWRLMDNASRCNAGAWAVREGTLKIDSLAERGMVCALGLSTNLFTDAYVTDMSRRTPVDYAVLLGAEKVQPVLEYSGSGLGLAFERPLRLTGVGGVLRNSTPTGRFCLYGVAAEDAGDKTLTLDGSSIQRNIVGNLADGAGKVSVRKTGSGIWRLEGEQTFSGELKVEAGTLVVAEKPTQFSYDYYKLTTKQNYKRDQYFWLSRVALYDRDGILLARNLVEDEPIADEMDGSWFAKWHFAEALQPGHVRWDMPSKFYYYTNNPPAAVFAENTIPVRTAMSNGIRATVPGYWPSIVWRMPENANPVAAFDIVEHVNIETDGRPAILTLYGSADGVNWTELYELNATNNTTVAQKWLSDGCSVTNNAVRPGSGYPVSAMRSLSDAVSYPQLANVSGLSVSAGASLKAEGVVSLSRLTVDCVNGNGTIDGFDFAAAGTVDLQGYAGDCACVVPLTFANLPSGALERLNAKGAWNVTIAGNPAPRHRVRFDANTARVSPPGIFMIMR